MLYMYLIPGWQASMWIYGGVLQRHCRSRPCVSDVTTPPLRQNTITGRAPGVAAAAPPAVLLRRAAGACQAAAAGRRHTAICEQ